MLLPLTISVLLAITINANDDNLNPFHPGPCPVSSSTSDYDENKVLGSWVAVKSTDKNAKIINCINATVEKTDKGLLIEFNLIVNETKGEQSFAVPLNLSLDADKNIPGAFFSNIENDGETVPTFQTIVTEKESFMLWDCCSHGKEHRETAFIQAKPGKTVSDEILKRFYDFLTTRGSSLKIDDFYSFPENECEMEE